MNTQSTIEIDGQSYTVPEPIADEIAHLRLMVRRLSEELGAQQAESMQREDTIAQILKDHAKQQMEPKKANSRLIEAAPELLAALQAILDLEGEAVDANPYGTGDVERQIFGQARAAITKATQARLDDRMLG